MDALPQRRPLSLPEDFVLLMLTDSGKVRDSRQARYGCAAAELGELALRGKLLVQRPRNFTAFGLRGYAGIPRIQVLDTGRTGLPWADDVLAELQRRSVSEPRGVSLVPWLGQRRDAFPLHRAALVERGLVRHKPNRHSGLFRVFGREQFYPDPMAHQALIDTVRAAIGGQRPIDEPTLFRLDFVKQVSDVGWTFRQRLDSNRGLGLWASLPESLRFTSSTLAFQARSTEES
jgi:hypothetical protein